MIHTRGTVHVNSILYPFVVPIYNYVLATNRSRTIVFIRFIENNNNYNNNKRSINDKMTTPDGSPRQWKNEYEYTGPANQKKTQFPVKRDWRLTEYNVLWGVKYILYYMKNDHKTGNNFKVYYWSIILL